MGAAADAKQTEFDEYRKQVRTVAIRTASERGWCDDGLNRVLGELGLPKKQRFRVPTTITVTIPHRLDIDDADSLEDAYARAAAMTSDETELERIVRSNFGSAARAVSLEVPPVLDTTALPAVGDPTPREGGMWWSGNRDDRCLTRTGDRAYVCTRPRHDASEMHVACTYDHVIAVYTDAEAYHPTTAW